MSRARPVHHDAAYLDENGATTAIRVPACYRRGSKTSVRPELTTDAANVTCKRCQRLLAQQVQDHFNRLWYADLLATVLGPRE